MEITANRRLSLALRIAAGVAASLAAAAHGLFWLGAPALVLGVAATVAALLPWLFDSLA